MLRIPCYLPEHHVQYCLLVSVVDSREGHSKSSKVGTIAAVYGSVFDNSARHGTASGKHLVMTDRKSLS